VFFCFARHIHETICGELAGMPVLIDKKLSHNHDKCPLRLRMMIFNADNHYTWDFVPVTSLLDANREYNGTHCGGLQKCTYKPDFGYSLQANHPKRRQYDIFPAA
jgi:hypothetical protein